MPFNSPFLVTGSKSQKCLRMEFFIVVLPLGATPLLGILQLLEIKTAKETVNTKLLEHALFDVCLIWQTPSFRDEQNYNLFWECKAENTGLIRQTRAKVRLPFSECNLSFLPPTLSYWDVWICPPPKQERKGGWEPRFALILGLNFRVLIQPWSSVLQK